MAGHHQFETYRTMYSDFDSTLPGSQDLSNETYTFKRIRPTELNIQHRKHVPKTLEEVNSQEHDALVQKWAGCGLTIVSLLTENLLCHPFIVLRRQCQVHYSSWNYRLEPLSIIPVTIRLLRTQQTSSLWKGVGSVLIVRGMTLAVEDVISKFTPLSKEWTSASLSSFGQHILLKCLSLAVTCPFYSASLVETVQSEIASEKPGIFDVFRDGLCRVLVWGSPQQGRMLPVWALIVPTVVLGILRYLVSVLVHKASYAVISDYRDKQHTRWGAIPKNSDSESEMQVTSGFTALVVSDVLLYPFETVIHRLHLQGTRTIIDNLDTGYSVLPILTSYQGAVDCFHTIVAEEGRAGLYKGFGALVLQFIAHAAVIRITKSIISHVTSLLRSPPPSKVPPKLSVSFPTPAPANEQPSSDFYTQPTEQYYSTPANSSGMRGQNYAPPSSPDVRQRATVVSRAQERYYGDEY